MSEPRQYTTEEVRTMFFDKIHSLIDYWAREGKTKEDALDGLAFSMLVLLDERYRVFPACHPEDPEYLKSQGENWYPVNDSLNGECEITDGMLHNDWYPEGKICV